MQSGRFRNRAGFARQIIHVARQMGIVLFVMPPYATNSQMSSDMNYFIRSATQTNPHGKVFCQCLITMETCSGAKHEIVLEMLFCYCVWCATARALQPC